MVQFILIIILLTLYTVYALDTYSIHLYVFVILIFANSLVEQIQLFIFRDFYLRCLSLIK